MEQKVEDMSTEELWKAKSQLLEQIISIPQQLQIVNAELAKRNKPEGVPPHESADEV